MENKIKVIAFMLSDLFLVSLFGYLAAVRIDLSLEGLISRAFNLNMLLLVVLLSGLGAVLCSSPKEDPQNDSAPRRLWFYTALISAFIGSIAFEVLKSISSWALLLSIAAGAIVFLVGFVMIRKYGDD